MSHSEPRIVTIVGMELDDSDTNVDETGPLFQGSSDFSVDAKKVLAKNTYTGVDATAFDKLKAKISEEEFLDNILASQEISEEDNELLDVYRTASVLHDRYLGGDVHTDLKKIILGNPEDLKKYTAIPIVYREKLEKAIGEIYDVVNDAEVKKDTGSIEVNLDELVKKVSLIAGKWESESRSNKEISKEIAAANRKIAEMGGEMATLRLASDTSLLQAQNESDRAKIAENVLYKENVDAFIAKLIGILNIVVNGDGKNPGVLIEQKVAEILNENKELEMRNLLLQRNAKRLLVSRRLVKTPLGKGRLSPMPGGKAKRESYEKYLGPAPRRARNSCLKF